MRGYLLEGKDRDESALLRTWPFPAKILSGIMANFASELRYGPYVRSACVSDADGAKPHLTTRRQGQHTCCQQFRGIATLSPKLPNWKWSRTICAGAMRYLEE
jgi:hypothetical protein